MDFDHPDHEPPRPVTPRAWVELSRFAGEDWVKIFVPDEPVILGGTQEPPPLDGDTYRTWSKRWIVYDSTLAKSNFLYGGPSFGNFKIGSVKGINVFFQDRTPLTPALDPHAPPPLDASRAALPLPAQLASSCSFGHAPRRRFRDRDRGAPTPEDIRPWKSVRIYPPGTTYSRGARSTLAAPAYVAIFW